VGYLVTLTLSLLTAPLATTAQPQGKLPRVAVLEPSSQARPAPCLFAFQQGLRDLGYVEGQTIRLDYRYGEGQADRLPTLAAELVQLTPDVFWLHSDAAAWAAKRATTTIPIVIGVSVGLVEQGLVASLAQPGGNLTGLEIPAIEVSGKRLELFKDAVPTGNGHGDHVSMFALRYKTPIAFAEPDLGFPTDVLDDFELFFQSQLEMSANFRGIAIGPGAFDQDASGMGVARFGNRPLSALLAGGILGGDQPQEVH
jgi:ABC transporter substrate binding protein